ncbi:P-loop NTPase fold protein [Mucilaginibacter ginsenosidivorax]|uniref:KAP NTPase domain-containing protein n=1 Tax=Mucilaginibacter ginsenosidivorax TaxID=862126 RepID=A0A5B8WCR0_9SPHI|nr:P-loop NTPase fold protein [Mucilaginibacter ginsenosidivorax]QEC79728.1 hypothetical protein FSB76_28635 [Mucilaginibacter ginsenosidivorax]
MKIFAFILRSLNYVLKRVKADVNVAAPIQISSTDLSMRANAYSYIDRTDEAETIFERIQSNSSSVIGIGGVRGAGKSSLALKILEKCKTEKNFTILIPSPTAYDSKEFLLTIYQCICEDIKLNLEQKIKSAENVRQRAYRRIANSARLMNFTLFFLTAIVCLMLLGLFKYNFVQQKIATVTKQNTLSDSSIKINKYRIQQGGHYLSEYRNGRDTTKLQPLAKNSFADSSRYIQNNRQYIALTKIIDSLKLKNKTDSISLKENNNQVLPDLKNKIQFPEILNPFPTPFNKNNLTPMYFSGIIICMGLLIFITYNYCRKKIEYLEKYPNDDNLYSLTIAKLEWLIYQVKLSSANEVSLPVSKFLAKFSRSKELQTRPLSLPGVTSDFNDYILEAVSVYTKIVICIDELDKIEDPAELNALLKGIKGIIGQDNTHFILTISEDALARFSNRFRKERDLIESSFEEIYFLNKIEFALARQIISGKPMIEKEPTDVSHDLQYLLIWLFGNGIPREIKRNILNLHRNHINIESSTPFTIWLILMNLSLESMKSWALVNNTNDFETYNFLTCLSKIALTLPSEQFSAETGAFWFNHILNFFSALYPMRFSYCQDQKQIKVLNESEISAFEKAIFETSILSLSYLLVVKDYKTGLEIGNQLQKTLNLLPYSYLLAASEFYSFLNEQDIYKLAPTVPKMSETPELFHTNKKTI